MRIACIGGGPAGLYASILFKLADPSHDVSVFERNRASDTFGFGVVFSDATLGNLESADPHTLAAIREDFAHWDAIDTHVGGEIIRSVGHGFCGLERKRLLAILAARAAELGAELHFECELSDEAIRKLADDYDLVIAADGLGSAARDIWKSDFGPDIDVRPNRFVWLGTTFPFKAFTFYFKDSPAGLWRIHAYRYSEGGSTFIAECTAETLERTGLGETDEDAAVAYLEELFSGELEGHRLTKNRSHWRRFPTVRNKSWRAGNVVLVGDAAHTAHFSIGSGTKLAMEDCIALARELGSAQSADDVSTGLARYEQTRRPQVERLADAAEISFEWFEDTERYTHLTPLAFTYSLLTRSLRVTHDSLCVRDGDLASAVRAEFSGDPSRPAYDVPIEVCGRSLASRIATITKAGLVLDDGDPLRLETLEDLVDSGAGSGGPGDGARAFSVDSREILEGDAIAALTKLASEKVQGVVVVSDRTAPAGSHSAHRAVARAADRARNETLGGLAVVSWMPGAAPSFLETLLLSGRTDLGVL